MTAASSDLSSERLARIEKSYLGIAYTQDYKKALCDPAHSAKRTSEQNDNDHS